MKNPWPDSWGFLGFHRSLMFLARGFIPVKMLNPNTEFLLDLLPHQGDIFIAWGFIPVNDESCNLFPPASFPLRGN